MIESITFNGQHYTPSEFVSYKEAHPEAFLPPEPYVPTFEDLKSRKLAEIATARYIAETGGVDVAMGETTVTIRTDRESQAMITGAALKATSDAEYSCRWKTVQGFVTVSAAQIVAVADAVRDHVQASFDREAELVALVDAAETVETLEAVTW